MENSKERSELDDDVRSELILKDMERLYKMVDYCKTTNCLRATLLKYFGEKSPDHCENCGNCGKTLVKEDITVQAQKILSCVRRVEKQTYAGGLGTTTIVQILRGGKSQRILDAKLDQLPTYGIIQDCKKQLLEYIDALLQQGYLESVGTTYPILRTTERANNVLFSGQTVELSRLVSDAQKKKQQEKRTRRFGELQGALEPFSVPSEFDENLYERLRKLRTKLAIQLSVPAYIVFSNATLQDMATKQPETMPQFLQVSGVGSHKAEQYGTEFIEEIKAWKQGR